jgi:hypothetical protein
VHLHSLFSIIKILVLSAVLLFCQLWNPVPTFLYIQSQTSI